ncbi:hypothetical protein LSPH24S_07270 [Lysinibacillus sphaericus]
MLAQYRNHFANEVLNSKEYHIIMYYRTPSAWTYDDVEKSYRFATVPYAGQIAYWITTAEPLTDPQKTYLDKQTVLDDGGKVVFAGIQPGTSSKNYLNHHADFNTKNQRFILNSSRMRLRVGWQHIYMM